MPKLLDGETRKNLMGHSNSNLPCLTAAMLIQVEVATGNAVVFPLYKYSF
jgi:hypothetical protein